MIIKKRGVSPSQNPVSSLFHHFGDGLNVGFCYVILIGCDTKLYPAAGK
jgi:hypothetical protein